MAQVVTAATTTGAGIGRDDLERLRTAFGVAGARAPAALWRGGHEFAGRPVQISVVGSDLARLVERAFAHLQRPISPGADPALHIEIWDEEATGVASPLRFDGPRSGDDGRFVGFGGAAWTGVYDRAECRLVAAVRAFGRLSYVDRARPFSRLLLVWYADRGYLVLHSGLVASGERGVLVIGPGRSGKSTTVLACAHAGWVPLGDDCVVLQQATDGSFTGHSVYGSLLVDPRAVRLFGASGLRSADDERGRELVYIDSAALRRAPCTAVAAMVLPQVVTRPRSALARMRRGEALRTLLPTALAMDSLGMGTRRGFAALTALLDSVPCHRLLAGSDWRDLPNAVRAALSS